MDKQNIYKIPSSKDRDFFRVDGSVYFHCEPILSDQGVKQDATGVFMPTFEQGEDDFVGLSIDAFREEVLNEDLANKDYFLRLQQLLAMVKRYFDAEIAGRRHKTYKKIMVNISGSGMRFNSETPYEKNRLLRISMFFPRFPFKFVTLIAEVIRLEKVGDSHEVRVQFKDLSENSLNNILRFVNQCQRDSRGKGP